MKTDIYLYPDFCRAVESDSLVYLFGTGISAALTGQRYSWRKWITDGIRYMKDQDAGVSYEQALSRDASAQNMVDIAGKVLAATKEDGTYDLWMRTSFETNSVTNRALADTLRKLLRTQDVFATTNYDRLLEEATGLNTLTYENPKEAYLMLDQHISTYVLHIHGVYDSTHGIDNIIADGPQYEAIRTDVGAQFIQNILGTRTLLFVGCGKTTDDGNISQFIQFANRYLKMDQDYYFLYRAGEEMTGMPDNIKLIPYGDAYEDLPLFLEDMARIRLKNFMEKRPVIGLTPHSVSQSHHVDDDLQQYHYSQQSIPFLGREEELEQLRGFLGVNKKFCWWSVTGQAGAGKSRLALEFLGQLPTAWFGFFLNDEVLLCDVENFAPFADTFVVIDYVSGRETLVAQIMKKMSQSFDAVPYRLRILLLERENSREAGSWYEKLLSRFGRFDAPRFADAEYGSGTFLYLGDLERNAVEKFIGAVCARHGLAADPARNRELCRIYAEKFEKLQFRPLFVQIFVEAWIENEFQLPRYDNFEDLLTYILRREQERWLDLLDGDQVCCNSFIHLLLRANVSGQLKITDMPDYYKEDWEKVHQFIVERSFPGRQREEQTMTLLDAVCQNIEKREAVIAPLFPDIIKEYMFCFYMEEERLQEVTDELWQNVPGRFSVFITRCLTDFPDHDFYKHVLQVYDANTTNTEVLLGRLRLLEKSVIEENDDPAVLIGIIDNEYEFWKRIVLPNDGSDRSEELALLKMTGLNLVARQYGGWTYDDVSPMMEVIEDVWKVPGGTAVQVMKQFFLQEHIRELSVAGFQEEACLLSDRLDQMLSESKEDDLWGSYVMMVNANTRMMNFILEENNLSRAMEVFREMERRCRYSLVEAVRIFMHSCFNMSYFACSLDDAASLNYAVRAAEKTALLYPEDEEIRSRWIGCRVQKLYHQYHFEKSLTDIDLQKKLQEIDQDLRRFHFGKGDDSDAAEEAFGVAWGSAMMLSLNVIEQKEEALRKVIGEAEVILDKNAGLTEVAQAMIAAMRTLYKNILRRKISSADVKKVFRYVEQNYDSAALREEFFKMLEESEEANNRQAYMTKKVIWGARQDARYNPMSGGGIPEVEEEERMLQALLSDMEYQEPYRRTHPKVGANDPCPCGSGKKFKKCCRGKGIYDF